MSEKLNRFIQQLEDLGKKAVYVGVPGAIRTDKDAGSSINMAELAAIHELGTPNTPERAPMRLTIKENQSDIKQIFANQIKTYIYTGTGEPLGVVGAYTVGRIQQTIQSGSLAPLDPKTIKRKGSSTPLIDTGQLVQSYTWIVKKNE